MNEHNGAEGRNSERALQHDQRFDTLRPLPARRALVVASYLVGLGSVALFWADAALAAPLVGLVALGLAFVLRRVVRLVADAPAPALDERLVVTRDAAFRTAYFLVSGAAIAALLVLTVAANSGLFAFEVGGTHLRALFWGYTLAVILTPNAALAWGQREV